MKMLADSGDHTILPEQMYDYLVSGKPLPSNPIMLTFDDTNEVQYRVDRPELLKYGFKGVYFIITSKIGTQKWFMNAAQIRQLSNEGNVIGCHTRDHTDFRKLKDADWEAQIDKPKKQLEEITGKPVDYFAFPFGYWNRRGLPELQKLGFKAVLPLHEFTYLSPAICAGTTPNQRKNWVLNYWAQAGPDFIHGDGAESFNQFIQRIDCSLQCIEFCEARNIFVFTHGHALRAIWQDLLYLEFPSDQARFSHFHQNMGLLPVPNTCLYKAIFQKNEWQIIEPQPDHFLSQKILGLQPLCYPKPLPRPAIFVLPPAPNCKPCDSTLFDIQGENITLLNPENPAKVSVKPQDPKAPGQAEMPVS